MIQFVEPLHWKKPRGLQRKVPSRTLTCTLWEDGFKVEQNIEYRSCRKCHCLPTIYRQNQNMINGLGAEGGVQNIDWVHLRKTAAILKHVLENLNIKIVRGAGPLHF